MKKVLALVLAVVLAFGMTTVAFAAPATDKYEMDFDGSTFTTGYPVEDGKVDLASTAAITTGSTANWTPGDTIYFPIAVTKGIKDSGPMATTKLADVSDFRISYSVDDGKNMIKSMKFVSMRNTSNSNKNLYIAVETNDNFIMEEQALDLTAKVSPKDGNNVVDLGKNVASAEYRLQLNCTYGEDEVSNGYHTVVNGVMKFDEDADDVTLCFDNDVEIAGNMKGQKDVFVRLSDSNDAIEEKYPDATVRFFDGNKDTFRREVTVSLPYEATVEKPYLYEVDAKGNLTKLVGGEKASKEAGANKVEYDDVTGKFTFKTNTLGNYVISDVELKSKTTDADAPVDTEKPVDGTEPNPGTGANDFVGLAVALAVVSVAGIAVAKRK